MADKKQVGLHKIVKIVKSHRMLYLFKAIAFVVTGMLSFVYSQTLYSLLLVVFTLYITLLFDMYVLKSKQCLNDTAEAFQLAYFWYLVLSCCFLFLTIVFMYGNTAWVPLFRKYHIMCRILGGIALATSVVSPLCEYAYDLIEVTEERNAKKGDNQKTKV